MSESPVLAEQSPSPRRRVLVPTWVQLAGLPLAVFFGWTFARAASHAVLVFLIATIISLMLNPIVRRLERGRVPRTLAVFLVFGVFCVVTSVLTIAAVDATANQASELRTNLPRYTTAAEDRLDAAQKLLDNRNVELDLRDEGLRFLTRLEEKSDELSGEALQFGREFVTRTAETLFNLILVVVITLYMLLDAPRIGRFIARMFPAHSGMDDLFGRLEQGLFNYVRGQTLASLVMGASATLGLSIIGATGIWPDASNLAILFGVIVAITEFAPTIGPIIGAIPPVVGASFHSPAAGIVVLVFFILLHQIEGHIVLPKLMGSAVGVHPLMVIFGILAGAQIFGLAGVILVLPLLALAREIVVFAAERFGLAEWPDEALAIATAGTSTATATAAAAATAAVHAAGAAATPPETAAAPPSAVTRAGVRARLAVNRARYRAAERRRARRSDDR